MLKLLRCLQCASELIPKADRLTCSCGKSYPIIDGIVVLNKNSNYYGEIKESQKEDILIRMEAGEHWRKLVWEAFRYNYTFLHHIIVDETRNDFTTILPITSESTVLDLGAGWGTTSCHLAHYARNVVSLDGTFDRCRFIQKRIEQDGIDNIDCVCVNILDKPFADNSFDIVVMNGVLEWVGESIDELSPCETQLLTLKEVRRILKPDGCLYIGIENSHGFRYILGGMDDHTALHHISYHERDKADELSFKHRQRPYKTYTYDALGYQELLKNAEFDKAQFYYPYPDYKHINKLFPLESTIPLQFYYRKIHQNQEADTEVERVRSLELHAASRETLEHYVASYSVLGTSTDTPSYIRSVDSYVGRELRKVSGTPSKDAPIFLQLSGTSGKQFSKGRLKLVMFDDTDQPDIVAISYRDKTQGHRLEKEKALLDSPFFKELSSLITPKCLGLTNIYERPTLFQNYLHGQTMTQRLAEHRYTMNHDINTIFQEASSHLKIADRIISDFHATTANRSDKDGSSALIKAVHNAMGKRVDEACSIADKLSRQSSTTLVHNDFVPWNIILQNKGLPAVLDWELASFSSLSFMDWIRFAWGTLYDLFCLKLDNQKNWPAYLSSALLEGSHPLSSAIGEFLEKGIGIPISSNDMKSVFIFFFAHEELLQKEQSQDDPEAIENKFTELQNLFN